MSLVPGVLALNLAFAAVGYAVLAPALRGAAVRVWASFAGVAFVVGAAVVPVVLCAATVAGARTGPPAFALVAGALASAGIGAALVLPASRRARLAPTTPGAPREGRLASHLAVAAAAGLAAVLLTAVIGGFRTTPWLDDSWFMWLPKGVALDRIGLDPRLFVPNRDFVVFTSPGYPWWWSILADLDVRAAGSIDLRALNGELALLLAGFAAAAARLLWGRIRPSLLFAGLLLLVVAPELLRQTQSGGADVPLALFVGLAAVAGFVWLRDGDALALALAAVFAAAAIQIKDEGLPQLVILLAVAGLLAWRPAGWRRVTALWVAAGVAALPAVPWLAWRASHDVPSEVSLGDGLHRLATLGATSRLGPSASTLLRDVFSARQWLVLVPLALFLGVAAAVLRRRLLPLGIVVFLGLDFAFWLWVYWSTTDDLHYRLTTSAYRVVVTPLVLSGLALLPLASAVADHVADRREVVPLSRRAARAKIG